VDKLIELATRLEGVNTKLNPKILKPKDFKPKSRGDKFALSTYRNSSNPRKKFRLKFDNKDRRGKKNTSHSIEVEYYNYYKKGYITLNCLKPRKLDSGKGKARTS
jgi:hypothetical protein